MADNIDTADMSEDATVVKDITVYCEASAKSVKNKVDKWLDGINTVS